MARRPSVPLRLWIAVTGLAYPAIRMHVRRRRARGKEDALRWREKFGTTDALRPPGKLIWLNAVGLGEVLALRGLIAQLREARPTWNFLVTSSTVASSRVFSANAPEATVHQFAPLDVGAATERFLDHWRPDLSIWSEQDLWPGLIWRADRRGIPLALVNARMNEASFHRRKRARGLFEEALSRFSLISAQDRGTAARLENLGARNVRLDGSLKPLAPPLSVDGSELARVERALELRRSWVLASSHEADERIAYASHRGLIAKDPSAVLVVVPRYPDRAEAVAQSATAAGLTSEVVSQMDWSRPVPKVLVADSFGALGLWLRVADAAYIGGTNDETEGHNPWEALALDVPVLHGPRTANFKEDFTEIGRAKAGALVLTHQEITDRLAGTWASHVKAQIPSFLDDRRRKLRSLCKALVELADSRTREAAG